MVELILCILKLIEQRYSMPHGKLPLRQISFSKKTTYTTHFNMAIVKALLSILNFFIMLKDHAWHLVIAFLFSFFTAPMHICEKELHLVKVCSPLYEQSLVISLFKRPHQPSWFHTVPISNKMIFQLRLFHETETLFKNNFLSLSIIFFSISGGGKEKWQGKK